MPGIEDVVTLAANHRGLYHAWDTQTFKTICGRQLGVRRHMLDFQHKNAVECNACRRKLGLGKR